MAVFIYGRFEWEPNKEKDNIQKHGVDFITASQAFLDSERLLAVDELHSVQEERMFCIGRAQQGKILTVRFTMRGHRIRIIGAGYWRKGKKVYETNKKRHQ